MSDRLSVLAAELFPAAPYQRELAVALDAAVRAGALCEQIAARGISGAACKPDASPITLADFGSQYIIASRLAAAFPEDPVIAEEDLSSLTAAQRETLQELLGEGVGEVPVRVASKRTQRFWTVDPIDGTKGYLRHGQYAVCVALAACGSVLLSVLVCPRLACAAADAAGTIFIAIRSHGAFHVSLHTLCAQRLPLRAGAPAGGAVLAESFEPSHTDHAFSKGLVEALCLNPATVRMDSQCKYGLVARGDANIYLRRPTRPGYREKIWDHAPGALLVQETGGTVTSFAGAPLAFWPADDLEDAAGIVATNSGACHEQVLAAVLALS